MDKLIPDTMTRRKFLNRMSLGLSAAAGLVVAVPIISYLLSPLIHPSKSTWQNLGKVDHFKTGQTVEVAIEDPSSVAWAGATSKTAVWVRKESEQQFIVFAVNCTHLGCPVNWLPDAKIFLCPCHGGVYYANGDVAGGPPPRPLFRYQVRVKNGQVQALTRPLPIG
ncbi:MAG TPA: ubiquinol-cytochrome c reductase iron-sulfur subunit [Thermomicrobiaceae bacterium]|nr:ubiquinol-cytochrome c reductase iron-sulfur subunit [Thermomicrobiaceae bacterium]